MRLREIKKDGIMNKILNGFLLVCKLVKLCNISHLMLFLFINLIRCEEKWVFFNNETFFNVALLKLFWFDCQIHYFVRDYDGFQLNSGLFFVWHEHFDGALFFCG